MTTPVLPGQGGLRLCQEPPPHRGSAVALATDLSGGLVVLLLRPCRRDVLVGLPPLFLSTRTVEWHLSNVYTMLGVGSRRELRRALASLSQADSQA